MISTVIFYRFDLRTKRMNAFCRVQYTKDKFDVYLVKMSTGTFNNDKMSKLFT